MRVKYIIQNKKMQPLGTRGCKTQRRKTNVLVHYTRIGSCNYIAVAAQRTEFGDIHAVELVNRVHSGNIIADASVNAIEFRVFINNQGVTVNDHVVFAKVVDKTVERDLFIRYAFERFYDQDIFFRVSTAFTNYLRTLGNIGSYAAEVSKHVPA